MKDIVSLCHAYYRWEFMTEEGDIGFTAYYLERNGERVDIVTNDRVQSHITMEEGEIICVRPVLCTYICTHVYAASLAFVNLCVTSLQRLVDAISLYTLRR